MATMEESQYPQVFSPHTKGPITQFVLEGKQVKTPEVPHDHMDPIRTMYNHSRREAEEGTGDFSINPDPVIDHNEEGTGITASL
ncbi:hypothetical protein MAR_017904 [Mya arenaria]|uniref:Uncharacterized protein n=1 Tax=Mya arenaria TaxID=6604 RepID=A0ABY7EL69_MYAAR|nr:hypothetical protein MAR_017794 [Mya arenaria]WAR07946.1 hypothetical protein MAR_017904 [Mya arenaria]